MIRTSMIDVTQQEASNLEDILEESQLHPLCFTDGSLCGRPGIENDYLLLRDSDGQASLSLSGNPFFPPCSASHLYLLALFFLSIDENITDDKLDLINQGDCH